MRFSGSCFALLCLCASIAHGQTSVSAEPGLLFYLSGERGFTADQARGAPEPNFLSQVAIIDDGAYGKGFRCADLQLLSYWAPGNVYAERGTLSFFFRSREPIGATAFPIFRVGYADHSSWDMVFLRIDYNGHGFDAFVTDANLARTRVSYRADTLPRPDQWVHLALAWDETRGIRFYVDGVLVGRKEARAVYYAGLDQFGPFSRVISPHQVQSAYQFVRGGDIDEIRIYDRMLADTAVARLAGNRLPIDTAPPDRHLAQQPWRDEWWLRYGWSRPADPPPYLADAATRVRKVEIHDVYDLEQWMWKGADGIRETTWPGVYNLSRLPGRSDYFILPDSNCYSLSGKSVTFTLPDEPWNQVEISGAAYGTATYRPKGVAPSAPETRLFSRPQGQERTFHRLDRALRGGKLRFENDVQETPIGELAAYNVGPGPEPKGVLQLHYELRADEGLDNPSLKPLVEYVNGRFTADERAVIVAMPAGSSRAASRASVSRSAPSQHTLGGAPLAPPPGEVALLPLVHVLIPFEFRLPQPATVPGHHSYTWENLDAGLDGIAVDLPPLFLAPTHGNLIPMNVQIKDPIWPDRNLLDFSFSVKPSEARTLWLDTRDRLLPNGDSLYLTLASASPDFGPWSLQGARLRLVFKSRAEAIREQEIDRFTQVRDNYAFMSEERPNDKRLRLYDRFSRDIQDLFRARPDHRPGRDYWVDYNPEQGRPSFAQPRPPAGVPLWAFRQIEVLKNVERCIRWWIDNRQIANGELGGGLSDDGDLTNQWPAPVLMGVMRDKITPALLKMMDAYYSQGMFTNGLATIKTDDLHSYEDGISVIPQTMLLDYASPKVVERLMATTRALERLTEVNAAGHRHIVSSYYSGSEITREGVWEWTRPNSYLIFHPAMALVDFNGQPRARQLLLDLADGYLAHRRRDASGAFFLPEEIHFSSDADRGRGALRAMSLFWSAWRWTGDPKYLAPILDDADQGRYGVVEFLNADLLDLLGRRADWGQRIASQVTPETRDDFLRHVAWQVTGDKRYLEAYLADQLQIGSQGMYAATLGHLWSDRVLMPSAELQRERLGGVALLRNRIAPGHVVTWDFRKPATGESVAILVPRALPTEAKILAFNLEQVPVAATMTVWDLAPGEWEAKVGLDANGDDVAETSVEMQRVTLEASRGIPLTFAPRKTTVVELTLKKPGQALWERPDLGIGPEDVVVRDGQARVRVHNLGALVSAVATLALQDATGRTLAKAELPAIEAPLDLLPRTAEASLRTPAGRSLAGCRVVVDPDGALTEITRRNNVVVLR